MNSTKNSIGTQSKFSKFMNKDNTVGYVFATPFIIGFLGFTIIPMIVSLYFSFTNYNLTSAPLWIGIQNYVRMFKADGRFIKSVAVTLYYVFVSIPLKLSFALLIAILLTKRSKAVSVYRSVYYLPSLIGGSVAVSLVWKSLFSTKGVINSIIAGFGATRISWFGSQTFAIWPLILMTVWQFGSSMIIFAAGLKQIPTSYYEAARIDGAGAFKQFLYITIPTLSPVILFNLVMQMISGFMSFTQAFIITNGGPNDSTNFYALYVYNQAFKYFDMGYASAMAWVLLIIIAAITGVIFKTSSAWVFYESKD